MKKYIVLLFILFGSALWGCSINISPADNSTSTPAPSLTAKQKAIESVVSPGKPIPVTWSNLDLSGRLIYLVSSVKGSGIFFDVESLDLKTGNVSVIFETPSGGWIDAAAVSPDLKNLIISYAPPTNTLYGSRGALYILPLDGSKSPQLLFNPQSDNDQYYQPGWPSDGKYIYFTHANYASTTIFEIMRMAYPDGKLEHVADQAYWSRISGDGSKLLYVSVDPATGTNGLYIAKPDGTGAVPIPIQLITSPGTKNIIDAPMLLPDNQTILFSAPTPQQSSAPSWVDKLMGITIASAHGSIPSDWWSIPITGGKPMQLTQVHSYALFASLSPDKKYIACFSSDGVFVMKPDGKSLTQIVPYTGGIPGTVNWIP